MASKDVKETKLGTLTVILSNGDKELPYGTLPMYVEQAEGKRPRLTFGGRKSSATVPVSVPIKLGNVAAFELNTGKGGTVRVDLRDGRTNDTPAKPAEGKRPAQPARPGKPKRVGEAAIKVGRDVWTVTPQATIKPGSSDISLFVRGSEGAPVDVQTDDSALSELFG